jgi:3-dehydroquinate synthase
LYSNIANKLTRIYCGNEAIESIDLLLSNPEYKNSKVVILGDTNTMEKCLGLAVAECDFLNGSEIMEVEPGENSKSIEIAAELWRTLLEYEVKRGDVIVNLGGGMITDLGSFVASTYKRGVRFIQVPTSLLAMVDAAVGGKTGINIDHYKNQVGTFTQPEAIIIDPRFLETLPKREYNAGLAEVIKMALICSPLMWSGLQNNLEIETLIKESVKEKLKIVEEDPFEKGKRKSLNFGHTIGHAIESFSHLPDNTPLLHGEAIALGMFAETVLSNIMDKISTKDSDNVKTFLQEKYKDIPCPNLQFEQLLPYLKNDKKNENQLINFTLLTGIGTCEINCYPEPDDVAFVINNLQQWWQTS